MTRSVLLLVIALLWTPTDVVRSQSAPRCFAETDYCIDGRIRTYWEQNGGLPVFGLPLSAQQTVTIEGQAVEAQWFERHRLELHPEHAPPYDVLLGRLGVDVLRKQGRDWLTFPTATAAQPGCRFFAETQHNVCGAILAAWQANGLEFDGQPGTSAAESLALFGLPLSPLQPEEIDGQTYQVQWFERARFELHPEHDPPYDVLLGHLGRAAQAPAPATDPPPPPAPSGPTGRLAFVRAGDIWTINADGSDARQLTTHAATDNHPVWAPDGTRIAFTSQRDGQEEVYVVAADGAALQRLTQSTQSAAGPAWAPDGVRLAYRQDGAIVITNVRDAMAQPVTVIQDAARWYHDPVWSSDGTRLAFTHGPVGDSTILMADLASGQLTRLTDGVYPTWSPTGNAILFEQYVPIDPDVTHSVRRTDLFRINADGTGRVNLTQTDDANERLATWSPDGTRVAYARDVTALGQTEVVVMAADGADPQALTEIFPFARWPETGGGRLSTRPAWSPDGVYIALERYRQTNIAELQGIVLIRADGTGEEQSLVGGGEQPAWQPQP
ncbi:MAG: hypothetical protein GYB64_19200 [Chloroflexi bacterium]|nr:hypothetical protein [Chloroflexota bacterium]